MPTQKKKNHQNTTKSIASGNMWYDLIFQGHTCKQIPIWSNGPAWGKFNDTYTLTGHEKLNFKIVPLYSIVSNKILRDLKRSYKSKADRNCKNSKILF